MTSKPLIRARYPILYIISSEETRVQQLAVEIAQKRQKRIFEWSCSTGIIPAGSSIQSQKHRNAVTRDPLMALDQVIDQVEPAIFLFQGFPSVSDQEQLCGGSQAEGNCASFEKQLQNDPADFSRARNPDRTRKRNHRHQFPAADQGGSRCFAGSNYRRRKQFEQVKIDLDDAGRDRLLQAALGLTLGEAENVFAKIIVQDQRLSGEGR
jgi:hypothetical protein